MASTRDFDQFHVHQLEQKHPQTTTARSFEYQARRAAKMGLQNFEQPMNQAWSQVSQSSPMSGSLNGFTASQWSQLFASGFQPQASAPIGVPRNSVPRSSLLGRGAMAAALSRGVVRSSSIRDGDDNHQSDHAMKRQRTMSQHGTEGTLIDGSIPTSLMRPSVGQGTIVPPRLASRVPMQPNPNPGNHAEAQSQVDSGNACDLANMWPSWMGSSQSLGENIMMDPDQWLQHKSIDELALQPPAARRNSFAPSRSVHSQSKPISIGSSRFPGNSCSTANMAAGGSLTSAPMRDTNSTSRRASNAMESQSINGAVGMMRITSQTGFATESPQLANFENKSSFSVKRPFLPEDLAGVSADSSISPRNMNDNFFPTEQLTGMERSYSIMSVVSSRSLKDRAKNSLAEQNNRSASTLLKPKPTASDAQVSARVEDKTSSVHANKEGKAPIAKVRYSRPTPTRVYCPDCPDDPSGFRGDHELRRHREAKHQAFTVKWVCVDPTTKGLPVGIQPVVSLDKCPKCQGKKMYGAYYNAAAHLRRSHFNKKLKGGNAARSRKGSGLDYSGDAEDVLHGQFDRSGEEKRRDKRGGKGGGDWPPIAELKNWMDKVRVSTSDTEADLEIMREEDEEADVDEDNVIEESHSLETADYSFGQNANIDIPQAIAGSYAESWKQGSVPLSHRDSIDFFSLAASSHTSNSVMLGLDNLSWPDQMSYETGSYALSTHGFDQQSQNCKTQRSAQRRTSSTISPVDFSFPRSAKFPSWVDMNSIGKSVLESSDGLDTLGVLSPDASTTQFDFHAVSQAPIDKLYHGAMLDGDGNKLSDPTGSADAEGGDGGEWEFGDVFMPL